MNLGPIIYEINSLGELYRKEQKLSTYVIVILYVRGLHKCPVIKEYTIINTRKTYSFF